jgi:hypothetical protein
VRPLSSFKQFDDDDRMYWLAHYNIEESNKNEFEQIQSFLLLHVSDAEFYHKAECRQIRRRVGFIWKTMVLSKIF